MGKLKEHTNKLLRESLALVLICSVALVGVHVVNSGDAAQPKVNLGTASYYVAPASGSRAKLAVTSPKSLVVGPKAALAQSLPPNPNFNAASSCAPGVYDNSTNCNNNAVATATTDIYTLALLDALSINVANYESLSIAEQIFVITNLERISRGLAPAVALTNQLNLAAQNGANANTDPVLYGTTLNGGATLQGWGSNWATASNNPLGADYFEMYDDGYGSSNIGCTTPSAAECWGHRDNILGTFTNCAGGNTYMGAAGSASNATFTMVMAGACGATPTDETFTWTQAQQILNGSTAAAPPPPPSYPTPVYQAAFQANNGDLYTFGRLGNRDWGLGMMAGTSPSITNLSTGGAEAAFQSNVGNLCVAGTASTTCLGLGMMAGTNPSIAAVPGGGFEVAFQANTSNLCFYGTLSTSCTGLGMNTKSSPSIAVYPNSTYEAAFEANTNVLWTYGTFDGTSNTNLGMMAGTSPSIAWVYGGFEKAFQANTGDLFSYGPSGERDWNVGMMAGTSPSITQVPSGYEMDIQANNSNLYFVGTAGSYNDNLGMMAGTSPGIDEISGGGYEGVFQANTGYFWAAGNNGTYATGLGMAGHTSPAD